MAAIDWNVSTKDQIRGRYFYNRSVGLDFIAALPVFFEPSPNVNNSLSISEFHNFSPSMENELRVSYSRNNQNIGAGNFKFPGLNVFPNIAIDDLQLQIGPDPNTPTGSIENLSQLQENLTKTWGTAHLQGGLQHVRHHPQRVLRAARARRLRLRHAGGVPAGQAAERRLAERRVG